MRRWLAKSLKRKPILFLLFALLLPLVSTGIVSYQIATSVTEEQAKQAGMNTLKQITTKLEFVIQDVENMSIFLIGEKERIINEAGWEKRGYVLLLDKEDRIITRGDPAWLSHSLSEC